ncbi:13310_t:CDS:2, partial [Funneliformis geosporum]
NGIFISSDARRASKKSGESIARSIGNENPDGYARYIARKLVPDEISYNTRIEKEEKCEISKENAKGIIQGLLN